MASAAFISSDIQKRLPKRKTQATRQKNSTIRCLGSSESHGRRRNDAGMMKSVSHSTVTYSEHWNDTGRTSPMKILWWKQRENGGWRTEAINFSHSSSMNMYLGRTTRQSAPSDRWCDVAKLPEAVDQNVAQSVRLSTCRASLRS